MHTSDSAIGVHTEIRGGYHSNLSLGKYVA